MLHNSNAINGEEQVVNAHFNPHLWLPHMRIYNLYNLHLLLI